MILRILVSPKIKINRFGAQGHVQKSRNHENEGFEGSQISKSRSYNTKLKQNNTNEILSISFPKQNCITMTQKSKKNQKCASFSGLCIRNRPFLKEAKCASRVDRHSWSWIGIKCAVSYGPDRVSRKGSPRKGSVRTSYTIR